MKPAYWFALGAVSVAAAFVVGGALGQALFDRSVIYPH